MVFRLPKLFTSYTDWLEGQQTSILSAAVVITIANIVSSLSGVIRQRLLISHFFDTPSSQQAFEAFLVAFQIPDLMFQLIVLGAVSAAFIPMLASYKHDKAEEQRYMSLMMTSVLLFFLERFTLLSSGFDLRFYICRAIHSPENWCSIYFGAGADCSKLNQDHAGCTVLFCHLQLYDWDVAIL